MRDGGSLVKVGIGLIAAAVAGWLITTVALSFAAQPRDVEDLTAAWTAAGATPLGESVTVAVPSGQTLVAFLVGTQLRTAGTTTGDCTATGEDGSVDLDWPVHVNPSLTGVLRDGQDIVAVAGWHNDGPPARVAVSCDSPDSGVEHFVAVPTRTGALERRPWFQPWGWLGLAGAGAALTTLGVVRLRER